MDLVLQIWGGLFYLTNKICFALAEGKEKNRKRQLKIMKTVRRNSINGNLHPSWTGYKSWGNGRKIELRFSKIGEPNIEKSYTTHLTKKSSVT